MGVLVDNERRKLTATAVNNLGVAAIAAGVIAPVVGYLLGSLQIDDPLRLLAFIVIWSCAGGALLTIARRILKGLI